MATDGEPGSAKPAPHHRGSLVWAATLSALRRPAPACAAGAMRFAISPDGDGILSGLCCFYVLVFLSVMVLAISLAAPIATITSGLRTSGLVRPATQAQLRSSSVYSTTTTRKETYCPNLSAMPSTRRTMMSATPVLISMTATRISQPMLPTLVAGLVIASGMVTLGLLRLSSEQCLCGTSQQEAEGSAITVIALSFASQSLRSCGLCCE